MNYLLKLYNYIEANKDLSKKLDEFQIKFIKGRYKKNRVIYNYQINSAKLI